MNFQGDVDLDCYHQDLRPLEKREVAVTGGLFTQCDQCSADNPCFIGKILNALIQRRPDEIKIYVPLQRGTIKI